MRRAAISALALILISNCGPRQQGVDRIIEDGIEVVLNHMEPYEIEVKFS